MSLAAEHLGLSVKTIRRWVAQGRIQGYRVGTRLIRVDLDELEQLARPIPTANGGDAAA